MVVRNAKKLAVSIGVMSGLLVAGLVVSWQYSTHLSESNLDTLTERSQQFLTEHGKDVATQKIEFGDQQAYNQSDHAYDAACFSMVMPFKSKPARVEEPVEDCILRLLTAEPISRVAIQVKSRQATLSEDPAITMRRANQHEYQESQLQTERYGQVLRFDAQDAIAIFWQTTDKTITVGFTGLTDPATVDDAQLLRLIESFQLNTTPTKIKIYEAPNQTKTATGSGF